MDNNLLNLPPLDAMRGFVAVARRMSITQAAQDLCLTQSAVSRQIQSLEEHFGTALFLRRHRALILTEAGEQLLRIASPWLDRLGEFDRSLRQKQRMRPVTISASIGVTSLWLLPRLGAFQAMHPNMDIRVAAHNQLSDLERDGVDLAIRYCREAQAPRGALRLFGEQIVPVANKAIASAAFNAPGGLLQQVLLEYDERARPWLRWEDWLRAQGMDPAEAKAFLHFNQYDQVIQAALEGHGVALGRIALLLPWLKDGRLVTYPGSDIETSDYAYWLIETASLRPEVEVFRDWILEDAVRISEDIVRLR
ncbi:LysR substrate-binding domain-containing protein [Noviherbaspirillum saxi]|uniref:LysR family transcriptional regulator n=1 Tax=Noviherbaspirillum saxi TaxID=2320863 RepID=A0A3A3G144_9BURK|nr:LysR substrate-binding domain-containing protein [Noviherbaspirillum saxi]RJF95156.1 LysR family transcriptional regulator [Noviherbaspirillum saxi]